MQRNHTQSPNSSLSVGFCMERTASFSVCLWNRHHQLRCPPKPTARCWQRNRLVYTHHSIAHGTTLFNRPTPHAIPRSVVSPHIAIACFWLFETACQTYQPQPEKRPKRRLKCLKYRTSLTKFFYYLLLSKKFWNQEPVYTTRSSLSSIQMS